MNRRHPTLEWLLAYAGGSTAEAADAIMASHLTLCPQCRRTVARLEALGGALLDATPASSQSDSDEGAAAAIAAAAARARPPARRNTGSLHALTPRPMADFIAAKTGTADIQSLPWRFYGPGVQRAVIVSGAAGAVARLLRSQPGTALARHDHGSDEIAYVLSGAYRDETGLYRTGDVQCATEKAPHRPVIEGPDECIALVVSEAPPVPTELVARLGQLFLGR
ncbi:MAG: cupin domain-containing protein [Parvularculaceae bacterium]|nr:cupin domain-containing protein [Parvularculaceae bacterium]